MRFRHRTKNLKETYRQCDISVPYETKNNFVENKIQDVFKYFNDLDDMKLHDDNNLEKCRTKLRAVEKKIAKQKAKRIEALDPDVTG